MNTVIPPQHAALLREKEVAQILSVSLACLRKWRNQDRGPAFVRLAGGSAVRYPAAELEQWIASQPRGRMKVA